MNKVISVFIAFILLVENSVCQAGSIWRSVFNLDPALEIYGTVEASQLSFPKNSKTVFLIKDIHCHYEAQKNIERILEILIRRYKTGMVAVEGAEGRVDLGRYGGYRDERLKEEVLDRFIKKGYVTGAEALNITRYNTLPFSIYGVEDGPLYTKNFMSFRESWMNGDEKRLFIERLKEICNRQKEEIFSRRLVYFEKKYRRYKEGRFGINGWLKYLKSQVGLGEEYKNIKNALKYLEIDIKELMLELEELTERVVEGLCQNDEQRRLNEISRKITILEKLFKLELTKRDLEYYERNRADFTALARNGRQDFQTAINTAYSFYKIGIERDRVLIEGTLEEMERNRMDKAVLIAGGFHADGITKILNEKKINYVVITPRIKDVKLENPYLSIMLDKRIRYNGLANLLAVPTLVSGAVPRGVDTGPLGLEVQGGLEGSLGAGIKHLGANVKEGLNIPDGDIDVYNVLNGSSIEFTIQDGAISFSSDALESAIGIVDENREAFYNKLTEVIKNRERLQGKGLNGTFTLHFGDDLTKEEYKTLFGNHKGDGKFYMNIRGFLNIDTRYRQSVFITGISHEMVHEFVQDERLEEELGLEDSRILGELIGEGLVEFFSNLNNACTGDLVELVFLKVLEGGDRLLGRKDIKKLVGGIEILDRLIKSGKVTILHGKRTKKEEFYIPTSSLNRLLNDKVILPAMFEDNRIGYVYSENAGEYQLETSLFGLIGLVPDRHKQSVRNAFYNAFSYHGWNTIELARAIRRAYRVCELVDIKESPWLIVTALLLEVPENRRVYRKEKDVNRCIAEAQKVLDRPFLKDYEEKKNRNRYIIQEYKDMVISLIKDPRAFILLMAHILAALEDPLADGEDRFKEMTLIWAGLAGDLDMYIALPIRGGEIEKRKLEEVIKDMALKRYNPQGRQQVIRRFEQEYHISYNEDLRRYAEEELPREIHSAIVSQTEKEGLEIDGIEVIGSLKSPYAIMRKIRYRYGLEKINDIIRVRITAPDIETAYDVSNLPVFENRIDYLDYICGIRRPSGYRALHVIIPWSIHDKVIDIEVQISTPEMQAYANFGPASHRIYETLMMGYLVGFQDMVRNITGDFYKDYGELREGVAKKMRAYVLVGLPDKKHTIVPIRKKERAPCVFDLLSSPIISSGYKEFQKLLGNCIVIRGEDLRNIPLDAVLENGQKVRLKRKKEGRQGLRFNLSIRNKISSYRGEVFYHKEVMYDSRLIDQGKKDASRQIGIISREKKLLTRILRVLQISRDDWQDELSLLVGLRILTIEKLDTLISELWRKEWGRKPRIIAKKMLGAPYADRDGIDTSGRREAIQKDKLDSVIQFLKKRPPPEEEVFVRKIYSVIMDALTNGKVNIITIDGLSVKALTENDNILIPKALVNNTAHTAQAIVHEIAESVIRLTHMEAFWLEAYFREDVRGRSSDIPAISELSESMIHEADISMPYKLSGEVLDAINEAVRKKDDERLGFLKDTIAKAKALGRHFEKPGVTGFTLEEIEAAIANGVGTVVDLDLHRRIIGFFSAKGITDSAEIKMLLNMALMIGKLREALESCDIDEMNRRLEEVKGDFEGISREWREKIPDNYHSTVKILLEFYFYMALITQDSEKIEWAAGKIKWFSLPEVLNVNEDSSLDKYMRIINSHVDSLPKDSNDEYIDIALWIFVVIIRYSLDYARSIEDESVRNRFYTFIEGKIASYFVNLPKDYVSLFQRVLLDIDLLRSSGKVAADTTIISPGGNSLLTGRECNGLDWEGIKARQRENIGRTLKGIVDKLRDGGIITHGNGPQVGLLLGRDRKKGLPEIIEETQEWIGNDIRDALFILGIPEDKIVVIKTHVGVDAEDVESLEPTKPIGITEPRPMVVSPEPMSIVEIEEIREAVMSGKIVICCGGGGIPVDNSDPKKLIPGAVIDKDWTTALLAKELNRRTTRVRRVIISTAEPFVYLNFGTPAKKAVLTATVREMQGYIAEGHFATGSMLPKVEAAIYMVENGGVDEVVITAPGYIDNPEIGTRIVRERQPAPDAGSIGKWEVIVVNRPEAGHRGVMGLRLTGIHSNRGRTQDISLDVAPISVDVAARVIALIRDYLEMHLSRIPVDEESRINAIIQHLEDMVRDGKVYLGDLSSAPSLFNGFSTQDLIVIDRETFNRIEGIIALFHEAGESYFASHPDKVPEGLNAHTYLRGLGKGARDGIRNLTEVEQALPEFKVDGEMRRVGLQDMLFMRWRNRLGLPDKLREESQYKIVAVCQQNVFRSVLTAYVLRELELIKQGSFFSVDSRGMLETNSPQVLRDKEIGSASLILAATREVRRQILVRRIGGHGRVMLVTEFLPKEHTLYGQDLPDLDESYNGRRFGDRDLLDILEAAKPELERALGQVKTRHEGLIIEQAVQVGLVAFEEYLARFNGITRRASKRFERREWQGALVDATARIRLYGHTLNEIVHRLINVLGEERIKDEAVWARMKEAFLKKINGRYDSDLALISFYSAMKRVFFKEGKSVEYADDGISSKVLERPWDFVSVYQVEEGGLQGLIGRILSAVEWEEAGYEDLERDSRLASARFEKDLRERFGEPSINSVEILKPVFFRNKGAYVVGRVILSNGKIIPLALALLNSSGGITLDTILTGESDISNIFGSTRMNFHVEVDGIYRELVDFLSMLMPQRLRAELYSSIGFIHPARVELLRQLRAHLGETHEKFEETKGTMGKVMVTFTLQNFPGVFKVISDRSDKEGVTFRDVARKYRFVHEMDRVGRMLDAMVLRNVRFKKSDFQEEVMAELIRRTPNLLVEEGDDIIIRHLYIQRKVIPLDYYLGYCLLAYYRVQQRQIDDADQRAKLDSKIKILKGRFGVEIESKATELIAGVGGQVDNIENEIRRVLMDFGQCIKDLAAAGVWVGDYLLKNFGVAQNGRVVSYDFDNLDELTKYNFYQQPVFMDEEGDPDHISVGPFDVFPEELKIFIGIPEMFIAFFDEVHGDLFKVQYWNEVKRHLKAGEVPDFFPYPQERRLRGGVEHREEPALQTPPDFMPPGAKETVTHGVRNRQLEEGPIREGLVYEMRADPSGMIITEPIVYDSIREENGKQINGMYSEKFHKARAALKNHLDSLSQTYNLLNRAGKVENLAKFRQKVLEKAQAMGLLIVKDSVTIHSGGPYAHARRGVSGRAPAIWIGEKSLNGLEVRELTQLILEESLHVAFPGEHHYDSQTGQGTIVHSRELNDTLEQILRKDNLDESYYRMTQGLIAFIQLLRIHPAINRLMAIYNRHRGDRLESYNLEDIQDVIRNREELLELAKGITEIPESDEYLEEIELRMTELEHSFNEWKRKGFLPRPQGSKLLSPPNVFCQFDAVSDDGLCVTGDTLLPIEEKGVTLLRVTPFSLKPIVDVTPGDYVLSLNEETQKIEPHRINALLDMGVKPVYKLTTASGRSIKTTANHPYLTRDGWVKVSGLREGDEIGVPRLANSELLIANSSYQPSAISHQPVFWDRIVSIEYIGYEHVYDIEVEGTHNFIGNGIFAHNTAVTGLGGTNQGEDIPNIGDAVDDVVDAEIMRAIEQAVGISVRVKKAPGEYRLITLIQEKFPISGIGIRNAVRRVFLDFNRIVFTAGEGERLQRILFKFHGKFTLGVLRGKELVYEPRDANERAYIHAGATTARGLFKKPQRRVWIGEKFLMWLLRNSPRLLEDILRHELSHFENPNYMHEIDPEYPGLLRRVEDAIRQMRGEPRVGVLPAPPDIDPDVPPEPVVDRNMLEGRVGTLVQGILALRIDDIPVGLRLDFSRMQRELNLNKKRIVVDVRDLEHLVRYFSSVDSNGIRLGTVLFWNRNHPLEDRPLLYAIVEAMVGNSYALELSRAEIMGDTQSSIARLTDVILKAIHRGKSTMTGGSPDDKGLATTSLTQKVYQRLGLFEGDELFTKGGPTEEYAEPALIALVWKLAGDTRGKDIGWSEIMLNLLGSRLGMAVIVIFGPFLVSPNGFFGAAFIWIVLNSIIFAYLHLEPEEVKSKGLFWAILKYRRLMLGYIFNIYVTLPMLFVFIWTFHLATMPAIIIGVASSVVVLFWFAPLMHKWWNQWVLKEVNALRYTGEIEEAREIRRKWMATVADVDHPKVLHKTEYKNRLRKAIQRVREFVDYHYSQGLLMHAWPDETFLELNIQPGDKVVEIGPAQAITGLIAALMGAQVHLLEHPDMIELGGLQAYYQKIQEFFKIDLAQSGGSLEGPIPADVTSDEFLNGHFPSRFENYFDHVIATDVLRPNAMEQAYIDAIADLAAEGATMAGMAPERVRQMTLTAMGIWDKEKVRKVISFMIRVKKPDGGTFYLSHGESTPNNIREVDGFLKALDDSGKMEVSSRVSAGIPTDGQKIGFIYHVRPMGIMADVRALREAIAEGRVDILPADLPDNVIFCQDLSIYVGDGTITAWHRANMDDTVRNVITELIKREKIVFRGNDTQKKAFRELYGREFPEVASTEGKRVIYMTDKREVTGYNEVIVPNDEGIIDLYLMWGVTVNLVGGDVNAFLRGYYGSDERGNVTKDAVFIILPPVRRSIGDYFRAFLQAEVLL